MLSMLKHFASIPFSPMTMKNKSFTLGAIAGITSFAIAVPILAQVSSAASASSASARVSATTATG